MRMKELTSFPVINLMIAVHAIHAAVTVGHVGHELPCHVLPTSSLRIVEVHSGAIEDLTMTVYAPHFVNQAGLNLHHLSWDVLPLNACNMSR